MLKILFFSREFWRKKIGAQKTSATMKEVAESFLNQIDKSLDNYKAKNNVLHEKFNKRSDRSEIALTRFLASVINISGNVYFITSADPIPLYFLLFT